MSLIETNNNLHTIPFRIFIHMIISFAIAIFILKAGKLIVLLNISLISLFLYNK